MFLIYYPVIACLLPVWGTFLRCGEHTRQSRSSHRSLTRLIFITSPYSAASVSHDTHCTTHPNSRVSSFHVFHHNENSYKLIGYFPYLCAVSTIVRKLRAEVGYPIVFELERI